MISRIISPGDRLEITKVVSEKKRKQLEEENSVFAKTLISQVYDVIDETQLKIAMPIVEGRVIPLPVNERFDVCFYTNGGLYKSGFTVIERYKENGLYVLVIDLIYELKKFQRRQYYRFECVLEVDFVKVDEEFLKNEVDDYILDEKFDETPKQRGIIMDISGGGIRFVSDEKLEKNSVVLLKLDLVFNDNQRLKIIMGKVLSSNKTKNNTGMYEQRIEYCDIKGAIREKIIKYIFEQERKMRHRE
ncbi:MAG: flagellar brake domain-containing protein [Lachnospiraceae bacterium]|nr:flagellar brake domain-containing protein [Lachnospiraceae bacterium]